MNKDLVRFAAIALFAAACVVTSASVARAEDGTSGNTSDTPTVADETGSTGTAPGTAVPPQPKPKPRPGILPIMDKREDAMDKREDMMDKREDRRDAATTTGIKDRMEDIRDKREDIRDKAEDVREAARENRGEAMKNGVKRVGLVVLATITRLEKLSERIESRAAKLEADGKDVSAVRTDLATVKTELDAAKADLESLKGTAASILNSSDVAAAAASMNDAKPVFESIRAHIKAAETALRSAVKNLKAAAGISSDN